MELRERLRHHIARSTLSNAQLAEAVGVSTAAITRWTTANKKATNLPTHENLTKLVEALGLTMEEFWRPIDEDDESSDGGEPGGDGRKAAAAG